MISSDDVNDHYSTDDRMEIMCTPDKVTRTVQKALRRFIAAVKWTLLTADDTGEEKTKWGKGKMLHTFDVNGNVF